MSAGTYTFFVQIYDAFSEESKLFCIRARNTKQALCFVLRDNYFEEELEAGGTVGSECPWDYQEAEIIKWLAEYTDIYAAVSIWGAVVPRFIKDPATKSEEFL